MISRRGSWAFAAALGARDEALIGWHCIGWTACITKHCPDGRGVGEGDACLHDYSVHWAFWCCRNLNLIGREAGIPRLRSSPKQGSVPSAER